MEGCAGEGVVFHMGQRFKSGPLQTKCLTSRT